MRIGAIPSFDWEQLGPIWGVEIISTIDERCPEFENKIIDTLGRVFYANDTEIDKQRIRITRLFLRKLARHDIGYSGPAFLGIANIEDDETFLKWFLEIYNWCWD